jgi:hypothetical protein
MAIWSWSDTPHGDLWCDMSVTREDVLEDVGLDAKERKFVWPDAGRLISTLFGVSISRIRNFPRTRSPNFWSSGFDPST